jgi:hypothetical protein
MVERNPYQQLRQIDYAINRFGMAANLDEQPNNARRAFDGLRQSARKSLAVLKDYEMLELEEDTRKQAALLPKAVKSLGSLRDSLLKASEYELVGAVDVAQMSAEIDELIDRLH